MPDLQAFNSQQRTKLRSGELRTGRFLEDSDPFDRAEYLVIIIILMSFGSARERYPVRSVDATRQFSQSYSFYTTDGKAWLTRDDLVECIYHLRTIYAHLPPLVGWKVRFQAPTPFSRPPSRRSVNNLGRHRKSDLSVSASRIAPPGQRSTGNPPRKDLFQ